MGVFNHFFVLRLSNADSELLIEYLDSINTPIEDVMKGKVSVPYPEPADFSKARNLNTSMRVMRDLLYTDTKMEVILAKLMIDDVIGSYN